MTSHKNKTFHSLSLCLCYLLFLLLFLYISASGWVWLQLVVFSNAQELKYNTLTIVFIELFCSVRPFPYCYFISTFFFTLLDYVNYFFFLSFLPFSTAYSLHDATSLEYLMCSSSKFRIVDRVEKRDSKYVRKKERKLSALKMYVEEKKKKTKREWKIKRPKNQSNENSTSFE